MKNTGTDMKNMAWGILSLTACAVIVLLCILLYHQQQVDVILARSHRQLERWLNEACAAGRTERKAPGIS